ncbi:CBM96 family carbohydrate-binding protein [Galbibacter mesophilus]|uniref:CBM96 family carbohydrate-binding protein n=1 Tax=Galbibacter mesophilus TaxID=379069 RepID=UPI00191E03AB|nr:DNRLRE domain-containing protein [Galbibacter mesophilus]MCM5662401.1 DNRLRE domain-containing protein [Galbibacter mesophilus]
MKTLLISFLLMASIPLVAQTTVLNPISDGFVNSKHPTNNYGSQSNYTIQPKASETREYFVKFDVSAVNTSANSVTLELYNTEWNNSVTNVVFAVQDVQSDSWSESSLTWNNRPSSSGNNLDSGTEANGGYTSFDVTNFVNNQINGDGIVSFYVYVDMSWGSNGVWDQRVDIHSKESPNPPKLTISNSDSSAPSTPGNLVASNITETSVDLSWSASTDNIGVTKYEVLKNSGWDQSVFGNPPSTSATVTGLTPRTTYIFYVKAADAAGNFSGNSSAITVKTAGTLSSYTQIREDNFENYADGTETIDYYYEQNCDVGPSCGTPCSSSPLKVSDDLSRCGSKSLRFTRSYEEKVLTGGSYCSARNEIGNYEDAFASYGDDVWIGFSVYIKDNYLQDKWSSENVHIFQFKNIDAGGGGNQYGSIITHKVDGVYKYDVAGYGDVSDVVLNQWTDIVVHLKYGTNNDGVIEVWIGDDYVKKTNVDFPEKQSCYVKFGTYSDVLKNTDPMHEVYYDEIKFGLAPDGGNYKNEVDCDCSQTAQSAQTIEKSNKNVLVYPNPSGGKVMHINNLEEKPNQISLYTFNGDEVPIETEILDQEKINLNINKEVSPGTYVLKLQYDGQKTVNKTIIIK